MTLAESIGYKWLFTVLFAGIWFSLGYFVANFIKAPTPQKNKKPETKPSILPEFK